MADEVYGLTVWPPKEIVDYVSHLQERHSVSAYGEPHLNLRYPFLWGSTQHDLIEAVRRSASAVKPFRAYLEGWHDFPNAVVIAIRDTPEIRAAHDAMLAVGGMPFQSGRDSEDFFPHVTVALSSDPATIEAVMSEREKADLPRRWWVVDEVALTLDDDGTLVEVARFPLTVGR
jgi:2'-5' RNA ligase